MPPAPSSEISSLIFDLGGVLLDIDFRLTWQAFADLGIAGMDRCYSQHHQSPLFAQLETGALTPADFRLRLCQELGVGLAQQDFDAAWNAMLVGFDPRKMAMLSQLAQDYRLFLLSNTNAIHLQRIEALLLRDTGRESLAACFEDAYYSHVLGWRKPDPRSYGQVLQNHGLEPTRTLFIDDTRGNIDGARQLGLQVLHVDQGMDLQGVLASVLARPAPQAMP